MAETRKPLLIIEDDPALQKQMRWAVDAYEPVGADDRASAIAQLRRFEPAVVTMDLGLPPHPDDPTEGFALLQEMRQLAPDTKIIVLTGQNDRANALRTIALGAYDFCTKPFDADVLGLTIDRAYRLHELQSEFKRLQTVAPARPLAGILTLDPEMQRVLRTVEKVAPTSATVLITGESGTGKELVARALHDLSPRANSRFVAINCAAIPETLLESELFGYEKGAFTGAMAMRKGHIEAAAGGTLFLDEIGELPPPVQVKLLRFLQEKRFQRVGARYEIHSDARVIAATNQDLKETVSKGTFREDLYFRLAVVVVRLPALRERGEDAAMLAREFLKRYGGQHGRSGLTFAADAVRALSLHGWPGNVRELQNRVQRAVIMADGKRVSAADLELAEVLTAAPPQTLKEAREAVERELVQEALRRHRGSITAAAGELGISRPTLYELMEKLGIARG